MGLCRNKKLIISRIHITAFVLIAALIWWGTLYLQGISITLKHLVPFGTVVSVLAVFWLLLDVWLWKCPILQGWFIQRPNLQGTWLVELQSDWINPETKEGIPPITCYMGVEQSLTKLQMHLMTPESESWLIANSIKKSDNGSGYQIVGIYTNKPDISIRNNRSEMHLGSISLETHGSNSYPSSLTGEYWTDRKTTGRMDFKKRVDNVFTRYEDANQADFSK
jgi:hypothetical protein